ncbi:MAG: hypothetical protein JSW27_17740 [Phycisphaerales bacterium]|nr:MAG: hypothetical protein JSW27_17740 [Phycisphaerales bacterium]
MLEEKLLLWRIRRGDAEVLRLVYERYKHDLLGLAVMLARDPARGEDIVHDVFVSFVRFAPKLRVRTSLQSYLLTSVANRVRTLGRTRSNGPRDWKKRRAESPRRRRSRPPWRTSGQRSSSRPCSSFLTISVRPLSYTCRWA